MYIDYIILPAVVVVGSGVVVVVVESGVITENFNLI
jgi:hypothetical protein